MPALALVFCSDRTDLAVVMVISIFISMALVQHVGAPPAVCLTCRPTSDGHMLLHADKKNFTCGEASSIAARKSECHNSGGNTTWCEHQAKSGKCWTHPGSMLVDCAEACGLCSHEPRWFRAFRSKCSCSKVTSALDILIPTGFSVVPNLRTLAQGMCPRGSWEIPSNGRSATRWQCCAACPGGIAQCYDDCGCKCSNATVCSNLNRRDCVPQTGCAWNITQCSPYDGFERTRTGKRVGLPFSQNPQLTKLLGWY